MRQARISSDHLSIVIQILAAASILAILPLPPGCNGLFLLNPRHLAFLPSDPASIAAVPRPRNGWNRAKNGEMDFGSNPEESTEGDERKAVKNESESVTANGLDHREGKDNETAVMQGVSFVITI